MKLNTKHQKTLKVIYADPVRSDIPWLSIEKMLLALGAEITEGRGSRVRVELNGVRMVFHRPHPEKVTDKGAVKSIRRFINPAGVMP